MDLILSILFGILAVFGVVLVLSIIIKIIDLIGDSQELILIALGIVVGIIIYIIGN